MDIVKKKKNIDKHESSVLWFIFKDKQLLVTKRNESLSIPYLVNLDNFRCQIISKQYLGTLHEQPCYAVEVKSIDLSSNAFYFEDLRALYDLLDEETFKIASKALYILNWDIMHKYCSKCGKELVVSDTDMMKSCTKCKSQYYPKIFPAIIVAVIKDDKILLARNQNFSDNMFSVIAGYVDSGETLEQCVMREVKEEVNIDVKNIKYFGSQAWPFTNSLMMGFTAEYAGGEIEVDNHEIVEADWFRYDKLPKIPGKISIANKLINWFINKYSITTG